MAVNNNPFSLTFGKEPQSIINRVGGENEIIDDFTSEPSSAQVYMITGLRGSGKTVSMTSVARKIQKLKNWIVVDLNPERDMIQNLAAELSNRGDLLQIFKDAKINLSFLGLGLEIDGIPPITDVAVALDRMLDRLTKMHKKLLITIDEATSNDHMREFASQFQIYLRKNYALYLVMTGLYENIYELQNEKSLTFLYRAPKVELGPLNQGMITESYKSVFGISQEEAQEMSRMTKGYPYAYQVLGYLCFKNKASYKDVISQYDMYLEEYVYSKIWSGLSVTDRKVLLAMSDVENLKVENIRKKLSMDSNKFTVYRDRLMKKGIIIKNGYGVLDFPLPRFAEFVKRM